MAFGIPQTLATLTSPSRCAVEVSAEVLNSKLQTLNSFIAQYLNVVVLLAIRAMATEAIPIKPTPAVMPANMTIT